MSNLYSYITSYVLPWSVEKVEEDERTPFQMEGWIGLGALLQMWYGFQKTILWHFLSCLHVTCRDVRPLRSCKCDLKSGPPTPFCFSGCKWLPGGGVCLCDRIYWQEGSDVGMHPRAFLFCHWNNGSGFDGLLGQDLVDLPDNPLNSDCPLRLVLLDAPRDSFLASFRGKIWRSTNGGWSDGQVE